MEKGTCVGIQHSQKRKSRYGYMDLQFAIESSKPFCSILVSIWHFVYYSTYTDAISKGGYRIIYCCKQICSGSLFIIVPYVVNVVSFQLKLIFLWVSN